MQEENKLGTQPVGRLLASMALPAMFSMLINALYNVVDSIYVARYSSDALAAVSLAFPVQSLLIAVAAGTGVGINSLIARRLGEGRKELANRAATHGLCLAVLAWVVFALLGIFATGPFLSLFDVGQGTYDMACTYTRIVTIVSLFSLVAITVEKIQQATGNMIIPMITGLLGAVINIILDPILIFGLLGAPELGVAGAAWATVIGQAGGMIAGLLFLRLWPCVLHVSFKGFRWHGRTVRDIYQVGVPSIVMQAITSVMTAGMNGILARFSEAAVSVLGAYFKLQSFIFMPVFGLTQGALPIMGYNFGARKRKRIMHTWRLAVITAAAIMLVGMLLFCLIPGPLLRLFNDDPELQRVGIPALRTISYSFLLAAVGIVNSTVFQAVGRGVASLLVSALRQLVIILPAAWILSRVAGLAAVWWAFPIAELFSLALSLILLLRIYRRDIRPLTPPEEVEEAV